MTKQLENSQTISGELALNILRQIPTPIMAVDTNLQLVFMNAAGLALSGMSWAELKGRKCHEIFNSLHCETPECRMKQAMASGKACTARNEAKIDGRSIPIEYTAAPLMDENGEIIGGLEYILDITQRVHDEKKLREQSKTIMEISTPAINLWDGIVVLPVVGVIDSMRAQQMMHAMLAKIKESSARIIILDIQGVAAVDTAVANHLIKITKATKLMGCRCIISGISPAVAETIVQLGIDLGDVSTTSGLGDALGEAFALLRIEVRKTK